MHAAQFVRTAVETVCPADFAYAGICQSITALSVSMHPLIHHAHVCSAISWCWLCQAFMFLCLCRRCGTSKLFSLIALG